MLDELCKDKEMLNRYRVGVSVLFHSRTQRHGVVGWHYVLFAHTTNIITLMRKPVIITARIGEFLKVKFRGINKAHLSRTMIG